MMLVLQDFFGVIVHRSFYTQPTIIGFHNHWNSKWLSHNMLLTTRPSKIKLAIKYEMFAKYSLNNTPILCLKK